MALEAVSGYDLYEIETKGLALTVVWDVNDQWSLKSVSAARYVDKFNHSVLTVAIKCLSTRFRIGNRKISARNFS